MAESRKICVLGLGYIGLPTASLLATKGYQVHGVDVRDDVVATINAGDIHITEPELDVLVRSAVQSGRLDASTEPEPADIFIVAVPTPFKDGNVPDLGYIDQATQALAPVLAAGNVLILESTSPVGTTERIARQIAEARPDLCGGVSDKETARSAVKPPLAVDIAHCPERVLPGRVIQELVSNDRIVGGIDDRATETAADFYREFVSGEVLTTESRSAELAKLAENTFRDVNIALANELSMCCEQLNIDVWDMIAQANRHPRVNILQPGPGVGGHCIAVDPWFIIDSAPEQTRLIRSAREVNQAKPDHVVARTRAHAERINQPVIACFGLSYKPNINDMRESPALAITSDLVDQGVGRILVVEPYIDELPPQLADHAEQVSIDTAAAEADILLGLVAHTAFNRLSQTARQERIVIDTCGIWR